VRRLAAVASCVAVLLFTARAQAQEPDPSPTPSPTPVPAAAPASSKVFNPDLAVIGNFTGAAGTNEVDPRPSLSLEESEVSLQAIVDPFARADFFLTFSDEEVGVEEGFITFTSLPAGFLLKAGKMKAGFGKVNTQHVHILPWVDRPLVMTNLLGGEEGIADAGLSLSRLFPNPVLFLEATGEVFRGEVENVFAAPRRRDVLLVGHLRAYRDLSESTNFELGGSIARGVSPDGEGLHNTLYGADATLRWRPLRRAIYRRLLLRSELMWSRREGGAVEVPGVGFLPGPTQHAKGFYASGEYQLGRRWFAGARYDSAERATAPDQRDRGGSLLLTYWPSEFSQIRAQARRTRYAEGTTANEILFQFLFSIGAHGAHPF
jgi:hypothetical protein